MYTKVLVLAALFFALTPGVLVSLPPGGSTLTVAATHAVVFALVYSFLVKGLLKSRR
jgi:hypothetical protein